MDLKAAGRKTAGYVTLLSGLLLLALAAPGPGPARADEQTALAASEQSAAPTAVRDIIARQLQAIHDRDSGLAFSLATSDFHDKFGDARGFMNHLRYRSRGIYDFDTFRFLDGYVVGNALVQRVEIHPHHSARPILALFRVERQENGSWLVDSFTVLADESQPI